MAEAVSNNNQRHLWKEVNKMTHSCKIIASVIDCAHNNDNIAEVFANTMESLYHSVPTDPTEMGNIMQNIQKLIQNEDSINECKLNFRDIDFAIMKLNKKKGDCNNGFYSDYIILSTGKFKTLISMLMNCMLIHWHSAEDLLACVIASIPKCIRSSLNTSDNYRGISFYCSL